MANNHKKITLVDHERWGLKYTEKRQWYFKMRLDFLSDSQVSMLKSDTKLVLLVLIKESLRVNKPELSICLEFVKGLLRVSLDSVKVSLRELKENNIIELDSRLRTQLIEENRREENRIKKKIKPVDLINLDFNLIYNTYPRKTGKKKGLEYCYKNITTQEQFDNLLLAVNKYKNIVADTEPKYIKQFSSFMNVWTDYILTAEEIKADKITQDFKDRLFAEEEINIGETFLADIGDDNGDR